MEPIDLLRPENPALHPVDPALAKARRISATIVLAPLAIAAAVIAVVWNSWMWLGFAACVLIYAWLYWLIGRQVRAHRYLEGDTDFFVASGRWWRSVTVVPYGRIQFIDIDEGPLLRAFGLAKLKLNTASASSDAAVNGLPRQEALALRDRLSKRAHDRMAGL
ncbi:MAG: PH domain-containing protein [Corynebacterium sp.]|uniref:PH domain-containing protein n=1 Tax=Corynebacterium sp. TaxID=1720 RepID=UPI0026DD998D|nr:PH domain-containing protein [Corynebacterium sp.]MDO5029778.1 PH domain-containing protein [Corynebacterium sp.]